jgi:hypothetical protein
VRDSSRLGRLAPVLAWAGARRVLALSGWASAGRNPEWAGFPPVPARPPPLPSQLGWRLEFRLGLCPGPVARRASLQAGYSLRSLGHVRIVRPCLGRGEARLHAFFAMQSFLPGMNIIWPSQLVSRPPFGITKIS